jgi:heptosyltransferase-2
MSKVLIIRFSSIGDIVLTSPVVRCIKTQMNGAEVHFLTKERFRPIVENSPHISKVYSFKEHINEIMPALRDEGYDHVIDLHNNLRSSMVKMKLQGRKTSFRKLNLEKWLMVNFKWNTLPEEHIVDRYMEAASPLGVRNDHKGLEYHLSSEEVPYQLKGRDKYICLAIGANHATKRMPAEMLGDLLNRIDLPVVIIGGKDEVSDGKIVERIAGRAVNLCGELSLDGSAMCVRSSALVITHDTGMMHIAAAFRKHVISLWGNTIPQFGMYPYMPETPERSHLFEVAGLNCRPCSKIGFSKCPKGHFRCMNEQDLDGIAQTVMKIWESTADN